MKFTRSIPVCLSILLASPFAFAATPRAFELGDLPRLVSLSSPRVSPDGRQIAVVVSTPDFKSDKAQLEIDLVDTSNGSRRALTAKRNGLASPKWSPDGTRLAFLAEDTAAKADAVPAADADGKGDTDKDADDRKTQIFVLAMNGGDAVAITDAKHGVDEFAWSPDGKQIAFLTSEDAPNAKAIKNHDDAFQVTDNHFLQRAALTPTHLWVTSSTGGVARRLTSGSFSLQTDQQQSAPIPAWSPGGHSIAFTRFPGPYWGPAYRSVITRVDAQSGVSSPLVVGEGAQAGLYSLANDGRFAYLRPRDGDQNNGNALYVVENGISRDLTHILARNFNNFGWLPGDEALLLQGEEGTHGALWLQPLSGSATRLKLGDIEASPDLHIGPTGTVAFVGSTTTHPAELYVMDSVKGKPRRLTELNNFVDELSLGRTETFEWLGPDGFHENGVLTYPVGYQNGQRYPLVLSIHGGPASASTAEFAPLTQLLAAAGFIVFQPNYRGGTSLGDAYQHAIFRDTGTGPGRDVMAGLTALKRLGIVDEARIGVSGWSYGGYMTTWLTGHYGGWKAAVAGAPLTDWVMDYTLAFYQQGDLYMFGGSPWSAKDREIWRDQSPINYASKVTTPTLLMGDVGDPNVPLLNAYEWFHALRDNGVEVEFYAYPVDTHFPQDIVRQTDVYRRWVDWMKKHLG